VRALGLVGLLIGLLATESGPAAAAVPRCALPDGQRLTFASGGVKREYLIDLPANGADSLTPLWVALHPLDWDISRIRQVTQLGPQIDASDDFCTNRPSPSAAPPAPTAQSAAAAGQMADSALRLGEREGFIAVFPGAINHAWDLRPDGVDTAFVGQLVSYLHAQGCGAPDRTVVSGYSMGAMLTSRLICARPDLFSGAAMVSAVYPPAPGCIVPKRMSIIGIHGTADQVVHWDGTVAPALFAFGIESFPWDRPTMMRMWAEAKGCATAVNGSFFITAATEYAGCPGSTTHMLGIVGGDHGWNMGGISVSEYIWEVLRPAERAPVMSATVALHRAVGDVGTTHSLPISAGATLTIDTGMPDATVHTGPDGRICVYTSATTHILWDQAAETTLPSHSPTRRLDTRS
jgi:poly(3-hydroxybutyrate) depolymerase